MSWGLERREDAKGDSRKRDLLGAEGLDELDVLSLGASLVEDL